MIRILTLASGLVGAAGLSQYPEFSQQYTQRLAGQVDALSMVVADFDASALAAGLTRDQALAQMTGTPFLQARQADMQTTFLRHARLRDNLAQLRVASPVERMLMPQRLGDTEVLGRTWADFSPAVPLSLEGLASAGVGFVAGSGIMRVLMGLIAWPFRRRRTA